MSYRRLHEQIEKRKRELERRARRSRSRHRKTSRSRDVSGKRDSRGHNGRSHKRRSHRVRDADGHKRRRSPVSPAVSSSREPAKILRDPGPPPNLLKSASVKVKLEEPKRSSRRNSRSPDRSPPKVKSRVAPPNSPTPKPARAKKRSKSESPKSNRHSASRQIKKAKSSEKDKKQVDLRLEILESKFKSPQYKSKTSHLDRSRSSRRSSSSYRKATSHSKRSPTRCSVKREKETRRSPSKRRRVSTSRSHSTNTHTRARMRSKDSKYERRNGSHSSSKDTKCQCKCKEEADEEGPSKIPVDVKKEEEPSPPVQDIQQLTSPEVVQRRRSLSYSSISSESSCSTCSSSSSSSCSTCSTCSSSPPESLGGNVKAPERNQIQSLTILSQKFEQDNNLLGGTGDDHANAADCSEAVGIAANGEVCEPLCSDKASALAALVCEEMKLSGKVDAMRKALNKEIENMTDFKDMLQLVSEKTDEFLGNVTSYDPSRKKALRQDLVRFLQSSGTMNSKAVTGITEKVIPKDVLKSPILSMVQDILAKKSVDLLVLKVRGSSSSNKELTLNK